MVASETTLRSVPTNGTATDTSNRSVIPSVTNVVAWLMASPGVHPNVRLFIITGFLGALTTFSSFSAESLELLHAGRYGWALLHSALHLFGSLGAAAAGFAAYRWI